MIEDSLDVRPEFLRACSTVVSSSMSLGRPSCQPMERRVTSTLFAARPATSRTEQAWMARRRGVSNRLRMRFVLEIERMSRRFHAEPERGTEPPMWA